MNESIKHDERRVITGASYQLLLFEAGHELSMWDINAENEDSAALIGRYESDQPFLPIHVGDFLDGRTLGFDYAVRFRVENIEHQIWLPNASELKHRLVLFVKQENRA